MGFAGGFGVCNSISGGADDYGEITPKCWTENEHSRVLVEVWEEFEVNGSKDSADEEQS